MVDPSPDSFVGQQVANFRIDKLVKDGTLSRIYLGRDVIQRRPVAVKIIDARQERDKVYLERFLREARGMMSAWWHQHITQVYYVAKRDGRYITVMEYVDGPNLLEVLARYAAEGELIPVDDVLRIGRAVAEALAYAQQHSVIHRDVKPSNILMCVDGRILLTDFGLAPPILAGDVGEIYGTPAYISPEQIATLDELDHRSDLYNLAVMLYELLVGRPPFQGETSDAVLQQHLQMTPLAPSIVNPQLGREVDAVLLKALAKSPEDRYQSSLELMDDLEQAVGASMEVLTEEGEMPPLPAVMQAEENAIPLVSQISVVDKIASQLEMSQDDWMQQEGELARRRRILGCWASLLLLMALLGVAGYYLWPSLTPAREESVTAVAVVAPTQIMETETAVPQPTFISSTVIVVITATPVAATPTELPTATPSAIPPVTPTDTPPTATPSPTATATPAGPPIHFHYSRYSFYMLNPANETITVSSVGFQSLDAEGQSLAQSFRGRDWSAIYPDLEPGRCNAIELRDAPNWLRPVECNAYNVTLTPSITYEDAFWLTDVGIVAFRVFWNGRDIGTCPVVTGVCELHLP